MFGRKTRELERRVRALEDAHQRVNIRRDKEYAALESRIRALEEATKPKSGRAKK